MNFVEFQDLLALPLWYPRREVKFYDLLALPFVVSKKRSHPLQFMISSFSFCHCFLFHTELKHLHVMRVENCLWCFRGRLTLSLLQGLANLVT